MVMLVMNTFANISGFSIDQVAIKDKNSGQKGIDLKILLFICYFIYLYVLLSCD